MENLRRKEERLMKEFLKRIKTNAIITAVLCTILGGVLVVWPEVSAGAVCLALGGVLALCGIADIVVFLLNRDGTLYSGVSLFIGILLTAVGGWIMTSPGLIAVLVPIVTGALICIHGAGNLGDALTLRRHEDPRWTVALALGLVTLLLGVVLVVNPFEAFTTVVRIIGAFLVYDGLSDLWITLRVSHVVRHTVTDDEAIRSAVDVDFKDVK